MLANEPVWVCIILICGRHLRKHFANASPVLLTRGSNNTCAEGEVRGTHGFGTVSQSVTHLHFLST